MVDRTQASLLQYPLIRNRYQRVDFADLLVPELGVTLSVYHGDRNVVTVFTEPSKLSVFWAKLIKSTVAHTLYLF